MSCQLAGCFENGSPGSPYCSPPHQELAQRRRMGQSIHCQAPGCPREAYHSGIYCGITHRNRHTPSNGQLICPYPDCTRFAFRGATYCSKTHRDNAARGLPPTKPSWPIATPLKLGNWRFLLDRHDLLPRFNDVLSGIKSGFTLKSTLSISETIVYPNLSSARNNPEAINEMIQKEKAAGRYHGPYTKEGMEAELGRSFISHPLGAIRKSDGIRWRIIEDLSWPHDPSVPSVNDLSDHSDVPVEWGGMADMMELVITAKKGTQGAIFDWGDAFRQLPIRRDELWMGVVQWNVTGTGTPQFYGDGNAKFGHNRSIGNFGQVNEAFVTLIQKEGIAKVIYWVDDLCTIREPINDRPPWRYNSDIENILRLAEFLGVPLPAEKIHGYSDKTRYIGFDWHWDRKEVEIPDEKKTKALEQVTNVLNNQTISRPDLRSLCGLLVHLAQVMDEGNARIRALYEMQGQMGRGEHPLTPEAREELVWWRNELQKNYLGMRLCTEPTPDNSFGIYVDASSEGIGVIMNGHYDSFRLASGWEHAADGAQREIGWAEFIAVELAVFFLVSTYRIRQKHILIHSDNQSVIRSWKARRAKNREHNAVLMRIIQMLSKAESFITLEYVPSQGNLADAASRGNSPVGYPRGFFGNPPAHLQHMVFRR